MTIALYPDSLVTQILAASTFPEQVVAADRWVQSHPDLKDDALAQAVDQLPWDPSVKALVAFPSVLGNMDKNLSWTSSLGDAYFNQEQDVMDAIQVMRRRAKDRYDRRLGHRDRAGQPRNRLRSCLRSLDRLWRPDCCLARLVSLSGHLVRRPGDLLRSGLRHRLLWGLRMGLASVGMRLAPPLCGPRPRAILLAKQDVL